MDRDGASVSVRKMVLDTIWFGRIGQIIAAAGLAVVVMGSFLWSIQNYGILQELKIDIGDRIYQRCIAEARTSAELSGAVILDEEPLCRRDQAIAQAKVVSMFGEFVWQKPFALMIKGLLLWFSLCVIAAVVRFSVREVQACT